MIRRDPARRAGFTLIEVIGALLMFSVGIVMMLGLTGGLSRSLEHSAINSLIAVEGQERMDSLTALTYANLTIGVRQDTLTVRGVRYQRTQTVALCPACSPLVKKIDVALAPVGTTPGPTYSATSYLADPW